MPIAKCTENGSNQPEFDIHLAEGSGDGPYLDFYLPDKIWPKNYNGAGVFLVYFEEILEHFLKTFWCESHGKHTHIIIKMLREYADKIERKSLKCHTLKS